MHSRKMVDKGERQVTHPWLMARQREEIELPPGAKPSSQLSAARRELEAAFGPISAPASLPQDSTTPHGRRAPEVVVKRKRALVAPAVRDGRNDEARDAAV